MLMGTEIILRFVIDQQIETCMKKVKYHRWDGDINNKFEDFIYDILSDYEYDSHVLFFSSSGGLLACTHRIRDAINSCEKERITFVASDIIESAATELIFTINKDRVRFIGDSIVMGFHLAGVNIRYTANGKVSKAHKRDMLDEDYMIYRYKDFWKKIGLTDEIIGKIILGTEVYLSNTECVDLCKQNGILEYGKD